MEAYPTSSCVPQFRMQTVNQVVNGQCHILRCNGQYQPCSVEPSDRECVKELVKRFYELCISSLLQDKEGEAGEKGVEINQIDEIDTSVGHFPVATTWMDNVARYDEETLQRHFEMISQQTDMIHSLQSRLKELEK